MSESKILCFYFFPVVHTVTPFCSIVEIKCRVTVSEIISLLVGPGSKVKKKMFMLNSAEHEIYPAYKC